MDIFVKNRIKWPHDFVMAGHMLDYMMSGGNFGLGKIDRIRRANAQKHVPNVTNSQYTKSNASRLSIKAQKTMPSIYYTQGSYTQSKNQETKGIFYKHICSACFAIESKSFPHPKHECRNKLKN